MVDESIADIGLMKFAFRFVKGRPMHVVGAHSGPSGIERARLDQPALILLDLTTARTFGRLSDSPIIDGVDVIQQLRADETTSHIPIVALSSTEAERDRALFHGADAFHVKAPDVPTAKLLARAIVAWFFARQMPRIP